MKYIVSILIFVLISCGSTNKLEKEDKKDQKIEKNVEKTIADYLDIKRSFDGYVTKDGKKFYLARKNKISQLFMIKDGKDIKLTSSDEGVNSYSVSESGKYILYLNSKGGDENYNIYMIDTDSKEIKPIIENGEERCGNVAWIDDNQFLYTSNIKTKRDFYIYHFDIKNKKSTLLVEKNGYNIITDVKDKDNFLFITYLGNNITKPYIFKNGKYKLIKGADEKRSYFPTGIMDDQSVIMVTNETQDLTYIEIWKDGEKNIISKDNWGIDQVGFDYKNRDSFVFCKNIDGYSDCYRYKDKKIKKLPLDKSVIAISQVTDKFFTYNLFKPDLIPTPAVFNFETKKVESFGYKDSNGIDVKTFVSPELKKVKSFDGVEIPYFLYIPKGVKPPYKTIFYFHGGPEAQFRPYFISNFQYYLKHGYMIVAPNVRGSSGYGQKFMDMDNYKKRIDSVKDVKAIIDQLIELKLSKKDQFIAIGGSYGGFMVVASMAFYPKNFVCGIDSVGVVDFVNFLKNTKSYRRKLREVEYGPLTDHEFLKSISPANMTDKIEGRLFVVHGKNDPRVPVSDAEILIKNMKKSGKHVEKLIFDDEGHGIRKRKNQNLYYMKSADFIERCFK